ncbi:hypothetical protein FRC01_006590 [Tulasnella sp. 417]|nr:hypothetical protein FRC01_006590 [Tulasnella sp. 417]
MPFQSSLPISVLDAAVAIGALLALILHSKYRARRDLPYPPGPRPLPLFGNLFHVPSSRFALAYTELGNQYGPLTRLVFPGQNYLVVNSFEAAKELLERRGSIYQDRPRWVMLRELMGVEYMTTFSGYSAGWRKQRAHLKRALSMAVVKRDYSSLLETKARQYLDHCSAQPDEAVTSLHRTFGEIVIELTYGRLGNPREYIARSENIAQVVVTGMHGYVVDMLPFLQYLPDWLPGMGFKRYAVSWKKEIEHTRQTVFETVKETAMSGDPRLQPSYMINQLKQIHGNEEELKDLKNLAEEEAAIANTGVETVRTYPRICDGVVMAQR